ncbi:deleted in malignant brain tumors 1 protein-like [Liolophura sinensis]|uniref:deleted in malignant brain tumors 1 protein-like n=1 Tax=Liolophura sinensis TaxID=3198878 RepID=UPI00315865AC
MYFLQLLLATACLLTGQIVAPFLVGDSRSGPYVSRVRLVDGEGPWQGRLEVYSQGQWGAVCDTNWDDSDARVVCTMLRYSPEHAKGHPSSMFGTSLGLPFLLGDVSCTGNEQSLSQCRLTSPVSGNCRYRDVGVDCFHPGYMSGYQTTVDMMKTTSDPERQLASAMSVTCDDRAFNVTVDTRMLDVGTSRAGRYNHITLGTSACTGHMEGDLLVIHALIAKCIPVVQETSTMVYYSGKLRIYHKEESGITRDHVTEVEVECTLHRELTINGSYVIKEGMKPRIIQAQAEFNTTMEFYQDKFFYRRITGWPHAVGLDQIVYVQLSIDSADPNLSLTVESCDAHDKTNTQSYQLIEDRCPVDETTTILPSGKDFARFKFSSFQFIGEAPEVYLDCDVMVCEPHDPAPNCQQRWCSTWEGNVTVATMATMAKRSRPSSEYKRRYFHLTAGPFLIPAKHSVNNTKRGHQKGLLLDVAPPNKPEEKSTEGVKIPPLLVLMCVVLATLTLVGIGLYLRKKVSGPVHVI